MKIDHGINPKKKNKDWIREYIKSCYNDFGSNNASNFYNARTNFDTIRQYMNGNQDITKYKKRLIPDDQAEEDLTYLNINWDILPVIPKFFRNIVQMIKNMRYTPAVHAVDNLAIDDQDKYYAEKAAEIILIQELRKAGIDPTELGLDPKGPSDFDELEMEMNFSYKDNTAKKLEIIIQDIFEKNRYEEDRDRLVIDIAALGVAIEQDYVDYDGEIRTRYVDPAAFVCPATDEPDYSDCEYMGEIRMMSVSEIQNECSEEDLMSDEWKTIKEEFLEKTYNRRSINPNVFDGDKFKVLYLEMKSTNEQMFEVRKRPDGSYVTGKKTGGKNNKEVFNGYFDVIYKGFWIVDTDFYFGCGLQTNMKRPEDSLKEAMFSYSVYSPEIRNGVPYSLGAAMVPIADQIQLAYYKIQNSIIKARPKGVAISADALQGVQLDGQEISPQENLDLFNFTGSMIMRFADEEGNPIVQAPIKELANGLGTEAKEYFEVIQMNISLLRDITGINEVTDGQAPDPKMLKNVAQMAQLSSNNSIRFIHDAERKLTDRVGTSLMNRIMDAAQDGTIDFYIKAVGSNAIQTIKLGSEVYGRKMALYFEEEPTQEQQQELREYINVALQSNGENGYGQITLDDAVYIKGIKNLKQAWQYLAYRVKKNREKMEEQARLRAQENAQYQQQSAMVAEGEKRKSIQLEYDMKAKLTVLEKQWEMKIEQLRLSAKIAEEKEKTGARISEANIQAESKEYIESKKQEVVSSEKQ